MSKNFMKVLGMTMILWSFMCISGYAQETRLTSHQLNVIAGNSCVGSNTILFISDRSGNIDIWKMGLDGSSPVNLTNNSAFELECAISPGQDKIAYSVENGAESYLHIMNIDGSNDQLITTVDGGIENMTWVKEGTSSEIAFSVYKYGQSTENIWINDTQLTFDGHTYDFDISPDGNQIVYHEYTGIQSGLFIMDIDGNNKHYLINGDNPAWSPDGNWIAYTNQAGIAIISLSEPATVTQLTNGLYGEIRWSQNSTKIFCLTNNRELWSIDIKNSAKTQLNFPQADPWAFSLLPDGSAVVYDNLANIYRLNLTGTPAPVKLTDNSLPGIVHTPKWSPDGNLVAYCTEPDSKADGLDWSSGIEIVAKDGVDRHEIIASQGGWLSDIVWSPDGEKISYGVYGTSGSNLWMVSKAGTGNTQLTPESGMAYGCSFSPACDEIVYSGGQLMSEQCGLWRMNLNVGTKTFLAKGSDPAWSPDGNSIAFNKYSWDLDDSFTGGLFIIPSSGGMPAILTTQKAQNPVWSPNSSMIAYTVDNEIWVIKPGTTYKEKVYTPASYVWSLCFSPDSQYIAFSDDMNVYTIKIEGGSVKQINSPNTIAWDVDWSSQNMLVYSGIGSGGAAQAPALKKMAAPKGNTSKAPPLYKASAESPQPDSNDSKKKGADIYAIPMGAPGDTGTITGSIDYSGTKTGTAYVIYSTDPLLEDVKGYGASFTISIAGSYPFTMGNVPSGNYYIGCWFDAEPPYGWESGPVSGDVLGLYGGTAAIVDGEFKVTGTPTPVVVEIGSITSGVAFDLGLVMPPLPRISMPIFDGNGAGWTGIQPAGTDTIGDNIAPGTGSLLSGSDIEAVYIAQDADNLYLRMDIAGTANTMFQGMSNNADKAGKYRLRILTNASGYNNIEIGMAYMEWQKGWGFWADDANNQWQDIPEFQSQGTIAVQGGIIELALPLNVLNHPSEFTIKPAVHYHLQNGFDGDLDSMQGFVAYLPPVTVDLKINGTTSAVTDAGGTLTLTCNSSPGGRTEFYYYLDKGVKGVIGVLEPEDIPVPGTFFEADNSHTDEEPVLSQIKRTTEFNGPAVTGHLLIKAVDVITGTSSYATVDFTPPAYSQSISGEVRMDGSLAANIIVMAQSVSEKGGFVAITDNNGQYTLKLPAGSWMIQAIMFGHPFSKPQLVYVEKDAQKIGVNLDITTLGLDTISGKVTSGGKPAEGVEVKAAGWGENGNRDGNGEGMSIMTDSSGNYTLYVKPDGTYMVRAKKAGYNSTPQGTNISSLPASEVNFELTLNKAAIIGTVTGSGGIFGAEISASNGDTEQEAMTNLDGHYMVYIPEMSGMWRIEAEKAGFACSFRHAEPGNEDVDFSLERHDGTISGTVYAPGGTMTLGFVHVSADLEFAYPYDYEGMIRDRSIVFSNPDGSYQLPVLEGQTYRINAYKGEYSYPGTITTASASNMDIIMFSGPDLEIRKRTDFETFERMNYIYPGATFTYHVSYANLSGASAGSVTIVDTLPEGIIDATSTANFPMNVIASGTQTILEWQIGTVEGWEDGEFDVVVSTDPNLPVSATLINEIEIYSSAIEANIDNNSATWTTMITLPDLEICKWGPGEVVLGGEISYDINYENVSDISASGVTMIDTLPPYVTYVSNTMLGTPSITGSGTVESPQVLTWNIGELKPMWTGGQGYFNLICRVDESVGSETTEISNVISIHTAMTEDTANNQATCTSVVKQPYLDLGISKFSYDKVSAGKEMSCWINYHNNSNVGVRNVVITDTLPDGVKYIRMGDFNNTLGEPTGTDTQVLTWKIPELKECEYSSFEIVVGVDAAATGMLVNTITITTLTGEADISNNQAVSWANVVLPVPDLLIVKYGPWKAIRGDKIVYSVQVNNDSQFDANDVMIIDYLPQGVTYSTNTLGIEPAKGFDTNGSVTGSIIWKLDSMLPWESRYFEITGIIDQDSPGTLTNVVEVRTSSQEEILGNNRATGTTMIEEPFFDLFINKGGSWWNQQSTIGEDYTYYISFGNQGNTDVTDVTIVDTLPAGVSYVSNSNIEGFGTPAITGSGTVLSPYVLTWKISVLAPSYWYYNNYFELTVHLDDTITDGADLINVANISTSMFGTETDDANNCSTFTVQASKPFVDLVISKSGWPAEVVPGSEITYWISYSNQGNSPSGAGTITDTLPSGVTYVDTKDNEWDKNRLGTPTPNGNRLEWYFDSIEPWEWGWLQIRVRVDKDIVGTPALTNMISISPTDNNPENNGDSFTTQVVPPTVDLIVEKYGPSEIVRDNASINGVEKVSYTIVLRNIGNSDAHDVTVVDTLPVGMTYATDTSGIPHTITGSGTLESPYQITWNYGTMTMSGWREVVRFELIGTISDAAASPLTNVVEVLCPQDTNPDNNRATVTTYIVQPEVDLGVWKGSDVEGVPGQEIEYQVYYWNKGNANAHGVVIIDHLPAGLVYISDNGNGTIATTTARGARIRWEIGKLGTGWNGYGCFMVRARIASDVTIGSVLNNVINIKSLSPESEENLGNNRATATVTVVAPMADLCISKYAAAREVAEGDTISYWINYRNNGNSLAKNVVITDYLPAGVSYGSDTLGITGTSTGTVTWNIGTVTPNDGGSFKLILKVDEAVSTLLTNVIEITSETDEKNAEDNRATSTVSVAMVNKYQVAEMDKSEVDLVIRKDGYSQAGVGQEVVYYITYSNQGPSAASNVCITDTLGSGMSYVSDDSKLATTTINNQVVWDVGTVSGWSKKRFKMRIIIDNNIPASSTLTNMVEIKTDSSETDYTNNKDTVSTHVIVPEPDLVISKWGEGEVTAGHKMEYQIRCINQGTGRASGVVIRDTLDNRVSYVSSTKQETGTQGNNVIWEIGDVEPGESVDFSLTVLVGSMVAASTTLTNVVEVTGVNINNNRATATTHVVEPIVDLSVYKFGSREVLIGKDIEYTINYANHSPSDALGVTITDKLDAGMSYVSNTSGMEPAIDGSKLIWAMGTVSAWEVKSFKVTVSQSVAASTTLTNRIEITSLSVEDNLKNNQATCTTHVAEARVDVKVSKWGTEARGGFEKTYYITYSNIGTMQADDVVLIDKLDANVEYLLSSPAGSYDSTSHSITWQTGSLAAQTDKYCQVVVRVHEETNDGVNIYNTIEVQTTSDESDYTNNKYTEVETVVTSMDPNDKVASPARCLKNNQLIDYTIHFENMATASASAILVKVIDRLDAASFDLSSMVPEEVGVGDVVYASVDEFNNSGRGSLTYTYDADSGTITWLFNFKNGSNGLPPNVTPHEGEGFINFSVKTKAGLSEGTIITNTADIRFDYNEWMTTPATVHVVDFTSPVSNVLALAATQTNVAFDVSWSGTDMAGGTYGAISSYSIEVLDNDGQWTNWLNDTIATSSTFYGKAGHSYAFRSIARDEAGNVEIKTGSDTSTLILSGPVFRIDPATQTVSKGDSFSVEVELGCAPDFTTIETHLSFDPYLLEVTGISSGSFPQGGSVISATYTNTTGKIAYAVGLFSGTSSGTGTVMRINFKAKAGGSALIGFNTGKSLLLNDLQAIPFNTENGTITISQMGTGRLEGYAVLDIPGVNGHAGVAVKIEGTSLGTTTDASGYFCIENVSPGVVYATVSTYMPGASPRVWKDITVPSNGTLTLGTLSLLNADADGSFDVDGFDFGYLRKAYFKNSSDTGWQDKGILTRDGYINCDFTGDGNVNAFDFGVLRLNFFKNVPGTYSASSPSPAPPASAPPISMANENGSATLKVEPQTQDVLIGSTFTVGISLEYAPEFTAVDLRLCFNPSVLEVATFTFGGFPAGTVTNIYDYDNVSGTIDYAVGILQGQPATGTGQVLNITFRAKAIGVGMITFSLDAPRQTAVANGTTAVNFTPLNGTMTVRQNTRLMAGLAMVAYGDNVELRGTLTDDDDAALLGKLLEFKVGDTVVGSITTNASGVGTISYTASLNPGTHTIMVSYAGNVSYATSSGTSTLRIGIHSGGGTQTVNVAGEIISVVILNNTASVFPEIGTVTQAQVPAFKDAKQIGACYEITVSGVGTATINIILPYNSTDVTGRNQKGLRIYYWDDVNSQWVKASDFQEVVNGRVIAYGIKHLSKFAIFSAAAPRLEKVIAYPNPYIAGEQTIITFGHPYDAGMQLTPQATIKIYNIAGELVATLEETNGDGILEWKAVNDDGEALASGVYIYLVTNPQNERYIGKLAIIR